MSHVNDGEDVLKSHAVEEDEQSPVDVHHAVQIDSLAEVSYADEQRDHLRQKIQVHSPPPFLYINSNLSFFIVSIREGNIQWSVGGEL